MCIENHAAQPSSTGETFLVCSYTNHDLLAHTPCGKTGAGVSSFQLSDNGQLSAQGTLPVCDNPAFLLPHPTLPHVLYGTTECIHKNGEVLTFHVDPAQPSAIRLVGRQDAGGRSTCFLSVDKNARSVTAVNYWDAKVCVLPLAVDGEAGPVCHTDVQPGAEYVDAANPDRVEHWQYRQRWPHTHCAVKNEQDNDGRLYVCDLGRDAVVQYSLDHTLEELAGVSASSVLRKTGEVSLAKNLGPRHIVFHPTLPAAYIVNELTSSVSYFKVNSKDLGGATESASEAGSLLELSGTISTLPAEWQTKQVTKNGVWKAASHCSEIRIHPSGNLLFIGNRGHDSLAVYQIDHAHGGALRLAGIVPSGGECPRNFNFSSTGRFVVVGNQNSDNLTAFAIDAQTGGLAQTSQVHCPSPNYVLGLPSHTPAPNTGG